MPTGVPHLQESAALSLFIRERRSKRERERERERMRESARAQGGNEREKLEVGASTLTERGT